MIRREDDGVLEEEERVAEEEKTKNLLAKAEISVLLDTYDDIFSDFDPRPFISRALSDDFLIEAKKATKDKQGTFNLSFMIPKKLRNFEHELLIRRRLRDHFKKHALLLGNEIHRIKVKGIFMAIAGIVMIMIASFLFSLEDVWFIHLLIVILEPAGWFTAWTGLDEIYYKGKELKPDLEFYNKMTRCEISFHTY